jgi:hypothetical protein
VALAVYWLLTGRSRELPWRRMLAVTGLIAVGVGLNGWYLLPDISYGFTTFIGSEPASWAFTGFFNTFGVIFDPLRMVPRESSTPALYVQAPVLALIWGLLAAPLAWRYRRLRAGIVTALIVLVGLLVVIMSSAVYEALPTAWHDIKFAYRLQTYVTLACTALVLVGALALTRRAQSGRATRSDRGLALGLGLVVAFGVGLSAWQLWVPNTRITGEGFSSYANRADALRNTTLVCRPGARCSGAAEAPTLLPRSMYWFDNYYDDHSLPVIATTAEFTFDPTQVRDNRLRALASAPPGLTPFATNIAGGPYVVHVGGGVRVVGRTADGHLVLERTTEGSGPVPVELSAALSAPVMLGRIATALSAALLLALALTAAVRRRRSPADPTALDGSS